MRAQNKDLSIRLTTAEQQLGGSRRLQDMLTVQHEQAVAELESAHARALRERDETAASALKRVRASAEKKEREAAARDSSLQAQVEEAQMRARALQDANAALEHRVALLEADVLQAAQHNSVAATALRAAHEAATAERQRGVALKKRLEEAELRREAMAASFREHKRLSDAARAIQRAFRAYRLRRARHEARAGSRALDKAQRTLGTLAAERDDLARRRAAELAFTGQTLVRENLSVLQEGVETLIATFLLPSKDLKSLARYAQKAS